MQGDRTGAGSWQEGGEAYGGTETVGEAQGGRARTVNGAVVPAESRADVSTQGFWKRVTTAMFDNIIVNLDAGSYLCMTPGKVLAKEDREKKDLYLQACLECIRTFTPMI